jgi:hypothetical protein
VVKNKKNQLHGAAAASAAAAAARASGAPPAYGIVPQPVNQWWRSVEVPFAQVQEDHLRMLRVSSIKHINTFSLHKRGSRKSIYIETN